ncbi:tellurite resistance TerB family protein [Dolichospermum circinale]|uniref:Tellurite resistance TerB family protein n=1 Tax=Dolichospermum circinale CS-537/01 TaxID=3021739 RepID=A0ABT5A924_9CYAN|nr:tellurite resistance TerB family protein [Dolichospermum circinale]MDB9482698.1 tellurite resistance TerB family protein [Dolichospermum circinale CS-537/05]MDB9456352.1 tellurite resistance TerB family protein [Dolichospermum circinale CS-541/06]MDB9461486.1 tellurite resistance TerB family protein [Dolichospermum circinale CS-541/04]MDB9474794.1 tellurite resistance TerB family protein [Dolichospermum circinale CS-537/11]MDB9478654.1 tellurite resistance TerB family protein [Dolichospermu
MTKYDYIFKSKEKIAASLNPEEAVVAIAVITTAVDVGLEDINGEIIADILWEFEIFDEYSEEQMLETVDTLIELAEDAGLGSLFNAANAAISEEVVLDGFAAGVIMLLDAEDLIIPADKKTYLKQLQIALELEDEEAEEIIEEVIAAVQEGDDGEYLDEEFESIIFNESGEQFYQSPLGNFTVPIPLDSEQGGKIQTDEGMVSFSDDLGTLLRIDYYPLSLEEIKEIKTQGYEAYLHEVIINEYVPQTIISNVPNAEVRHREYWQEPLKRYYYVVLNIPGATISQQETNGHGIKSDTYRGLLSFVNSECLYIVSSQRSLLNGETLGSVKEEAEKMKQTILNFVETIEFVEI